MGIDDERDDGPRREREDLVRRVLQGDKEAERRLFAELHATVASGCRARLDATDAEDVCQETMAAVWRGLGSYRAERGDLGAFVRAIMAHKVADALRERYRRRVVLVDELPDRAADVPDPMEVLLRREEAAALDPLLAALTRRERHVLVLRVAYEVPAAQVSDLVGASPAAVRVIQHRTLKRVRAASRDGDGRLAG